MFKEIRISSLSTFFCIFMRILPQFHELPSLIQNIFFHWIGVRGSRPPSGYARGFVGYAVYGLRVFTIFIAVSGSLLIRHGVNIGAPVGWNPLMFLQGVPPYSLIFSSNYYCVTSTRFSGINGTKYFILYTFCSAENERDLQPTNVFSGF